VIVLVRKVLLSGGKQVAWLGGVPPKDASGKSRPFRWGIQGTALTGGNPMARAKQGMPGPKK
jgi:hypothetical protein